MIIPETRKFFDPRNRTSFKVNEVEKEWRTQIGIGIELLGCKPSHLDSHHGVHRIPELFPLYLDLAAELGVPVRGTIGADVAKMKSRHVPGSVALVRNWTGKDLPKSELISQIEDVHKSYPEEKYLELIVHPGFSDDYLRSISSLSDARENDFSVVKELGAEGWNQNTNMTLISRLQAVSE